MQNGFYYSFSFKQNAKQNSFDKFPYEIKFRKKPEHDVPKAFDCQCFPCLGAYNKHKLQEGTDLLNVFFVGYGSK